MRTLPPSHSLLFYTTQSKRILPPMSTRPSSISSKPHSHDGSGLRNLYRERMGLWSGSPSSRFSEWPWSVVGELWDHLYTQVRVSIIYPMRSPEYSSSRLSVGGSGLRYYYRCRRRRWCVRMHPAHCFHLTNLTTPEGGMSLDLAKQFPNLHFVIQDRPHVVALAEELWKREMPQAVEAHRVEFMAHDFFKEQPIHGAEVYLMRYIMYVVVFCVLSSTMEPDVAMINAGMTGTTTSVFRFWLGSYQPSQNPTLES